MFTCLMSRFRKTWSPPDKPPYLRRLQRRPYNLLLLVVLPQAGLAIILNWVAPFYVVAIIFAVILAIMGWKKKRRLRDRIEASGLLLCVECAYDLRGSADRGRCPECGVDYEADSVKASWREYLWEL